MCHPGNSSGFSHSPVEDQSMPAPYTDYPRASYLVQTSSTDLRSLFHSTTLRTWSAGRLQSSGRRPWNHIRGAHFLVPGTPAGCRAREWGPFTQQGLLVWSPWGLHKCYRKNAGPTRTRLKPKFEERKIYYANGPAAWFSPKLALAPQLRAVGFLCLRMQIQANRKDKSRRGS
jgi:hypothetical protein